MADSSPAALPNANSKHSTTAGAAGNNFIRQIVEQDLQTGKHKHIITRFPPEPNGFLHIGHAKSICLNFGLAKEFGGQCNLRFDDTNPAKEEQRYIDSIMEDIKWMGFSWGDGLYYASDYFEQLYQWAEDMIKKDLAYVDDQTVEQIRATRGDITTPGQESPFRNRSIEENLDLFRRMRAGEFPDGARVLRAKVDMASGNMNMRDPILYRIMRKHHPRTGDTWVIYPMYDYAHGQSDSIEAITHSICTLEFELHRPLYDWFQEKLDIKRTRQIEFARLNVTYMMCSKRKLLALVTEQHCRDWDDPRMPTLSGLRRRGYPAAAMRTFCERIGVAKRDNQIGIELLEACVRDTLEETGVRRFAVLNPLKLVIENYPEGQTEEFDAANHPNKPEMGTRKLPFSRELYIERDDFMEVPAPKYFRLSPGAEVRLRFAYWVKCTGVVKNEKGEVTEVRCTYDPATRNGENPPDGRKVKGTIHWVEAKTAVKAEVRLYDRLFTKPDPEDVPEGKDWRDFINPESLKIVTGYLEPALTTNKPGDAIQFERLGYFTPDYDSKEGALVFNRSVGLADSWAKESGAVDAEKEAAKLAREKAAAERAAKKAEQEKKKAEKEKKKAEKKEGAAEGETA